MLDSKEIEEMQTVRDAVDGDGLVIVYKGIHNRRSILKIMRDFEESCGVVQKMVGPTFGPAFV